MYPQKPRERTTSTGGADIEVVGLVRGRHAASLVRAIGERVKCPINTLVLDRTFV